MYYEHFNSHIHSIYYYNINSTLSQEVNSYFAQFPQHNPCCHFQIKNEPRDNFLFHLGAFRTIKSKKRLKIFFKIRLIIATFGQKLNFRCMRNGVGLILMVKCYRKIKKEIGYDT